MTNLGNTETTIQPPPGIDVSGFEGVANSINDIFASVSKDLEPLDTTKLPAYLPDSKPCPTVKEFEVFKMLNKVKVAKAGVPDGISARLIKEFSYHAYELSKPHTDILNQSYREGMCHLSGKRLWWSQFQRSSLQIGKKTDQFP